MQSECNNFQLIVSVGDLIEGTAEPCEKALKDAKLKAINLTTGEVSDLLAVPNERTIGGYSDLRMDNVNKKLYVGDAISDVIFVVELFV